MFAACLRLTVALGLLAPALAAQQARGTILGTVTDASGAAIPGAAVAVTNTSTGASFKTLSSTEGFFTAPSLAVGTYTVSVEHTGFRKAIRSGIVLELDQRARVDVRLEVGTVAESLEVTAQNTLIDTSTATVGKVVENRRLTDLPLNGRNALALVMLTPAVKSNAGPTNSGFSDRGIELSSVSINAGPSTMNSYLLDGGTNNHAYFADPIQAKTTRLKVGSALWNAAVFTTRNGICRQQRGAMHRPCKRPGTFR